MRPSKLDQILAFFFNFYYFSSGGAAKQQRTTEERLAGLLLFIDIHFHSSFIHSDIFYSFILSFFCTLLSLPVERLFFAACLLDTALAALGQRFFWSNLTTYLLFFCILLFEAPSTPESSGSFLTLHRVQSVAYRVSQAQTIHR